MGAPTTTAGDSKSLPPKHRSSYHDAHESSSSSSSAPLLSNFGAAADGSLPTYTDATAEDDVGCEPPAFSEYEARHHFLSNGKVVSHDAHLNTDVEALYQFLRAQAAVPPKPRLRVEGTHSVRSVVRENGHNRTSTNTATDFDLTFDLSSFLLATSGGGSELVAVGPGERRRRGGRNPAFATVAEVEAAPDARDRCLEYVRCPAALKEFTLRKRLRGFDEDTLRFHVESMIRSTNYRGTIRVTFPVESRSVVVAPANIVCRIRYGRLRWFFYLSFLWLLTWPLLWLFTKRWDVVDAVYDVRAGAERDWVDRWGWVLARIVRQKRQQRQPLGVEHLRWIECHELAESERLEARRSEGGILGFLRSISEIAEAISGGWGADEW